MTSTDILKKVDDQLKKYKADHGGDTPLYILVSSFDEEALLDKIRRADKRKPEDLVTTYHESKILRHNALEKGELLMSNELPDTGS